MYLLIGYSNQPTNVGCFYKTCFLSDLPHPHLHILGQNLSTVRVTTDVIPVGCFQFYSCRFSVGRCVITCAFFGKSVKHTLSCKKMYPV